VFGRLDAVRTAITSNSITAATTASSPNAILPAHTELGTLAKAEEARDRAVQICLEIQQRPHRRILYSSMVSTLLSTGKGDDDDDAKETLARCPSLERLHRRHVPAIGESTVRSSGDCSPQTNDDDDDDADEDNRSSDPSRRNSLGSC
jgi:hypothetical protein